MSERRIEIVELCEHGWADDAPRHSEVYQEHGDGTVMLVSSCLGGSRIVISEIPDEWTERAAKAIHATYWQEAREAEARAALTAALFGGVVSKEEGSDV
jgi:hypothetical protein